MFKLSKYELRKNRNTLLILLGGLALLQILFLFALSSDDDSYILSSVGTLVLYGVVCYFAVFLFAVSNYYREINSKTSYLVFMTPVSSLRVILSKMLTVLLLGILTGGILLALGSWDVRLLTEHYDEYTSMTELINDVLRQFGINPLEIAANLSFGVLTFLLSFFSTVALVYFCITLSATLLQNSRFKLICSILFFLAGSYIRSKLEDLIPAPEILFTDAGSAVVGETLTKAYTVSDMLMDAMPYTLLNLAVLVLCVAGTTWMLNKKLSL